MPFCQISPNVRLHYITNTPDDDHTLFDPAKPSILLLHAFGLDVSWLRLQFQDPRLTNAYNLIAFDARNLGGSRAPYTPYRDSYVDAADLGFAFEVLQLPPMHMFAIQSSSVWTACRFALLFPSNALSLCIVAPPADSSLKWIHEVLAELIELLCFPQDLETFERAAQEISYFQFSGQVTAEMEDEVIGWWEVNLPPRKRRAVIELMFGRCPPTAEEYARIQIPTLIMTGDRAVAHPVDEVLKLQDKIPRSQAYVVKGAPENFPLLPQYSGIAHRVYRDFLSRQAAPPTFLPGTPNVPMMAKRALKRLAEIRGNPAIALRDPTSSISFSMWPPENVAANQAMLDQMEKGEDEAFSPLDAQGVPLRKFSQRHDDQWTSAGFNLMHNTMKAIEGIRIRNIS